MKNIFYFFYIILTLLFFPFIIIIDIFINIKRKDFLHFLYKRYFFSFFLKKNHCKNNCIFIIATSAGEINSIINHIDTLFKNNDVLIFTTSFTGYQNLEKIKHLTKKNFFFTYLFPENILYTLYLYLKFKPLKTVFIENEIWPSILIISKWLNLKNILIQAKMTNKEFKKYSKLKFLFKTLYSLFNLIFTIDSESYKYFKILLKNTDIILSGNLKINKQYPLPGFKIPKLKSITFASTHKEEEDIFIDSTINIISETIIKKSNIKEYNNNNNYLTFFFVPRHPERAKIIFNKFEQKINNKFSNNLNIDIEYLSKLDNFFNLINHIFSNKNTINFDILYKSLFLNKLHTTNSNSVKIIVVDKFGILLNLYCISYITVIGATFFEHGGGHNILEPLYYNNFVVSGPFLTNLKDIFDKGIENNLCFLIRDDVEKVSSAKINLTNESKQNKLINLINFKIKLNQKTVKLLNKNNILYSKILSLKLIQILSNYSLTYYNEPTFIKSLTKKVDPLQIIASTIDRHNIKI